MLMEPSECGLISTQSEYLVLMSSTGYFTYDFIAMALLGLLDLDMTVHHILCVSGLCVTLQQEVGANLVVMGLFVAEISNPAMHMRIMLKHIGLRYA